MKSLNSLLISGIPEHLWTIEIENTGKAHKLMYNINSVNGENEQVYNNETETNSFLSHNVNSRLESVTIQNQIEANKLQWPSITNEPFNEYSTPYLATLGFPTLFPDGQEIL